MIKEFEDCVRHPSALLPPTAQASPCRTTLCGDQLVSLLPTLHTLHALSTLPTVQSALVELLTPLCVWLCVPVPPMTLTLCVNRSLRVMLVCAMVALGVGL